MVDTINEPVGIGAESGYRNHNLFHYVSTTCGSLTVSAGASELTIFLAGYVRRIRNVRL